MTTTALDRIDIKILNELQQNASLTNVELASRVNLSPSPCLARVKTLEKLGVIDRRDRGVGSGSPRNRHNRLYPGQA